MTSHSRSLGRLSAVLLLVVSLSLVAPQSANASPETLRRSLGNILLFPLDFALSPIVALRGVGNNIRDTEDTTAVRVVYFFPGFLWYTGVQLGASVLRGVTGAIELLPGIGLYFFDADLDTLYDPVERGSAIVDWENPLAEKNGWKYVPLVTIDLKFGIDFTTSAY